MRLGITGSRHGHPDTCRWMLAWVERHGVPELFVLGDNHDSDESVDWQAYQLCLRMGWPFFRIRRDQTRPWKERNRERNQLMVDVVRVGDAEMFPGNGLTRGAFLAFPCPRSRGTWHCVGRAEAAGLVAHVNRRLLGKRSLATAHPAAQPATSAASHRVRLRPGHR